MSREDGSSTKEFLNALCKVHKIPPPKVGPQLDGINESIHAIAAGYGTMLAPSIAASSFIQRDKLREFLLRIWIFSALFTYVHEKMSRFTPPPFIAFFILLMNLSD